MFFFIGIVVVFVSVLGGYLPHGSLSILIQPLEWLIILGSAIGAFIIANPKDILKGFIQNFKFIIKDKPHSKSDYLDLLSALYALTKLSKQKGNMALEAHAEDPHGSYIFKAFPSIIQNKPAVIFLSDYLRLLSMGCANPNEIEALMDEDIEAHLHEGHAIANAVGEMGQSLPAFGIVAAVLGVIVTMGSITEPPEILGGLIGAALVGTFFGVFVAYAFVAPMGNKMKSYVDADKNYYLCIKSLLLAHLQGHAPVISVEFGRKIIPPHDRPNFLETEHACENHPQETSS